MRIDIPVSPEAGDPLETSSSVVEVLALENGE